MSVNSKTLDAAVEHHQNGELAAAVEIYQEILSENPENADAWHLMGVAAHQQGNNDLALTLIQNAIGLNDKVSDFHSNLGMVRRALGDDEDAEAAFRRAIEVNPAHAKALSNLAGLLRSSGQFTVAVDYARRAVQAEPMDPEVHINLGNAFKDLGGEWVEDATRSYQQAVTLTPDYALAHWNLSLALLSLGQYEDGFAEMKWRWLWSGFPAQAREFAQPNWLKGEDISDQRILLHAEQGLGDTIHFVRYGALLKELGATVIFECPDPLGPLITETGLVDEMVKMGDPLPAFDCHAALLDLPHLCNTSADSIPADVPYLSVPTETVAKWQARVAQHDGLKIGLNWRGNTESPVEQFRTLPPDELTALSELEGVSWYSLQKGSADQDVPALADKFNLIDTGSEALVETAGLITALDLVITSDTAVAHLAGALGKPVWLLLHHAPDWRWLTEGVGNAWYPSARLFRQSQPGAWAEVIAEVKAALADRIH